MSAIWTTPPTARVAAEPLQYRNLFAIKAPHFVMYVQDLLADQLGVDRLLAGGLRVYTTLDLGLQEAEELTVRGVWTSSTVACRRLRRQR
ncbi:MAG: hypothetical protein R3A10_23155 [Caldilineaceae bacterium]